MRYRLEPAMFVIKLTETKILVTSSEELARKAYAHHLKHRGFGTSARMLYGLLLEYDKGRRFLRYLEAGRVYTIDELREIAESLSWADKLSFKYFLNELPEYVKIYDKDYIKSKDRIPRVFQREELPFRMLKNCVDVTEGSKTAMLICEFSKSYWIVAENPGAFNYRYEVLLIPKDIDLDAVARYLEPEHARRIIEFKLPDVEHEAVEKAKELKALLALLFPGVS
ncbi:MAG: hypothetical protein QW196_02390 [Sulfolobales archaeon]